MSETTPSKMKGTTLFPLLGEEQAWDPQMRAVFQFPVRGCDIRCVCGNGYYSVEAAIAYRDIDARSGQQGGELSAQLMRTRHRVGLQSTTRALVKPKGQWNFRVQSTLGR
jgi:hypothetical protein